MTRIDVTSDAGYMMFIIAGRAVVAYQPVLDVHHLIAVERPAQSYESSERARQALFNILREEGGNVVEMIRRGYPDLLLPL